MSGNSFCVAGWCTADQKMIRPLPGGANWTSDLLFQFGVVPGATIWVESRGIAANGTYPHRTEDFPVDPAKTKLLSPGPGIWFGPKAPSTSKSLAQAFEGNVERNSVWKGCMQGVHVPAGLKTRSLWGLACSRSELAFIEDFGKLKCELNDGMATYKLPISSHVLKDAWRKGGLGAVVQALPGKGLLHVRVGLARAFEQQPDKCYIMINGIHW